MNSQTHGWKSITWDQKLPISLTIELVSPLIHTKLGLYLPMPFLRVGMQLSTVTKRVKECIPISVWILARTVRYTFFRVAVSLTKLKD